MLKKGQHTNSENAFAFEQFYALAGVCFSTLKKVSSPTIKKIIDHRIIKAT
jgi:hypothetical protein